MKATATVLSIVFLIISIIVSLFALMQIWGFTMGVVFKAIFAIIFFFVIQCLLFYGITKTECSLPSYKTPKTTHKIMIYYLSVVLALIVFSLAYIMFNQDKRNPEAGAAALLTIIIFSFIWPKKDKIDNLLHCDNLSLAMKKEKENKQERTTQEAQQEVLKEEKEEHHHSHHHHHHHHSHEEKKEEPKTDDGKLSEPMKTEKKASSRYCHCPFCGSKIHSDSIYCKYCGKKVDEMLKEA